MDQSDSFRMVAPLIAAGTVFVAGKGINAGYQAFTGNTPPRADDLDAPVARVVLFAVSVAAVSAVINTGIQRTVAASSRRSKQHDVVAAAAH